MAVFQYQDLTFPVAMALAATAAVGGDVTETVIIHRPAIIYQVKAEPVLVPPKPVVFTVPSGSWSQPPPTAQIFQYQARATDPFPHPPNPLGMSSGSWSQPPPTAVLFQYDATTAPVATPAAVTTSWFAPLSEPVRTPARASWFQPDTIGRPASDVTGIKFTPLSEPVRTALRDVWFQGAVSQPVNPVVSFSYFIPLSDPVRLPPRTAWFQPDTLGQPASDVTGIKFTPLSEPVRTAPRTAWYQPDTLGRPASDVTGIKFTPLSEPVRTSPRTPWYQDAAFNPQVTAFITQLPQPWSEPVRTLRTAFYQFTAYTEAAPFPEEVSEDRWHQPWSEPVRSLLRTAYYEFLAWNPNTPAAAAAFLVGPLGENLIIDRSGIIYPAHTEPVFPQPNPVTLIAPQWPDQLLASWYDESGSASFAVQLPPSVLTGWFAPLSEPVRVALRAAWFQPWAIGQPDFTDVTGVKYPWWQEPVRSLPRTVWFQPDTLGRPASDVTGIKYPWWQEPVRSLPRAVWFQPATAFAPQPVVPFSYFNWLSDPVRTPARTAWFRPETLGQPASDVTGIKYPWWLEPVRSLPRTPWYQDQAAWQPFTPPAITDVRWYTPLSEPVRLPQRTVWFDPSTRSFQPVVSFSYFNWLSEPVRMPARLFAGAQPFLAFAPNPVVSFSYYNWLSEPVRFRPSVVWQQFTTPPRPFIPVEPASFQGWYAPWREPVRLVPRAVWFQDAASFSPFPIPRVVSVAVTVPSGSWSGPPPTSTLLQYQAQAYGIFTPTPFATFGTMHAVELGDVFFGAMVQFGRVASGEVAVVIKPIPGEVGLIVPAQFSANVAAVAAQPTAQSGAPVTPVASAYVSIRVV